MIDDRGTVRRVAWRELFSWLVIFRTFTLALSLPLLLLATAAVIVQPLGWRLSELIFLSPKMLEADPRLRAATELFGRWPGMPRSGFVFTGPTGVVTSGSAWAEAFNRLAGPYVELFNITLTLPTFCYFLLGGLWMLALWAFVGGVITRVAVVYLGREERLGVKDAVRYTGRRYGSYVAAPLYPLLGVFLLAIPLMILGLLMRLELGVIVAGILWIFVLIVALAMAFLLIGLFFGWARVWPTISAENGDAFEALSRSYGYTFQRPLHYLFYAVVAILLGILAWFLVTLFADWTVRLAWWGVSWGTGHQRIEVIMTAASLPADTNNIDNTLWVGTRIINFFNGLVYCTALGFAFSFFFCAMSAIYLLLRQVDDETEFDEVYAEDIEDRFTLPELKPDAAGVPTTGAAAPDVGNVEEE